VERRNSPETREGKIIFVVIVAVVIVAVVIAAIVIAAANHPSSPKT